MRPRNLHFKAILYFLQGNWEVAEDLELQVLELEPRYHFAWGRLGLINLWRGDFAAAVANMETALEIAPGHPDLLEWLLGAYLALDQEALARQIHQNRSFEEALLLAQYSGIYPPIDWDSVNVANHYALWLASDAALAGVIAGRSPDEAAGRIASHLDFDGTLATLPDIAGTRPAYLNLALILRLADHVSGQIRLLQAMRDDGRVPDRGRLVHIDE